MRKGTAREKQRGGDKKEIKIREVNRERRKVGTCLTTCTLCARHEAACCDRKVRCQKEAGMLCTDKGDGFCAAKPINVSGQ